MNRRESYQFVGRLRTAARAGDPSADDPALNGAVLAAVRTAMLRRRGQPVDRRMGDHPLLSLLEGESVQPLLDEHDLLGRVYQALNAPALEQAYRGSAKDRRKFTLAEIPAVTQLFTPGWVVRYLLHNTLGRQWVQWHPDTQLTQGANPVLDWIIPLGTESEDYCRGPDNETTLPSTPGNQSGAKIARFKGVDLDAAPLRIPPATTARAHAHFEERSRWKVPKTSAPLISTLRILDPACGTMNFGLVAYDLLNAMYHEEMDRAGEPGWPAVPSVAQTADIPLAILQNNLFGIDIDPIALDLARASLELKSGVRLPIAQWNLWQADSLFDEAIASRFHGRFDIVVTNPPYLSSRNLPTETVVSTKKTFPHAWRDLYACFIDRSLDFARQGGWVGLLAMQSFMFTGAYQKLRRRISERASVETLAHFGPGLFEIGNPGTLQTAAFVLRKEQATDRRSKRRLLAYRLVDVPTDQKAAALYRAIHSPDPTPTADADANSRIAFRLSQADLNGLPRMSWAYWVDASARKAFATFPRLGDISPPRQGLATTDNLRFVRYWWEVEPTHAGAPAKATAGRWMPYAKGGQFRRWYEAPRYRVNWETDGREIKQSIVDRYPYLKGDWKWVAKNSKYYGRVGICWSYLTSGQFSARRLEAGSIFDVAGSSFFPDDLPGMLAILNSSAAERLLAAINPTVNFQVGDLAELPIPPHVPAELATLAESAIALQASLDAFDESSPDFTGPMPWEGAAERSHSIHADLTRIESAIDAAVCDLYGFGTANRKPRPIQVLDRTDLACRWVSYALGLLLGRWGARSARSSDCNFVDHRGENTVAPTPAPSPLYSGEKAGMKGHAASCAVLPPAPHPNPLPRVQGRGSKNQTPRHLGDNAGFPPQTDSQAFVGSALRIDSPNPGKTVAASAPTAVLSVSQKLVPSADPTEIPRTHLSRPHDEAVAQIRQILRQCAGESSANEIEIELRGLDRWLMRDFYPWHVRLYSRRPPIWAFSNSREMIFMLHDVATRAALVPIFKRLGLPFPADWERNLDNGILPALAPLRAAIPEAALRRGLDHVAMDIAQGRMPWCNQALSENA